MPAASFSLPFSWKDIFLQMRKPWLVCDVRHI